MEATPNECYGAFLESVGVALAGEGCVHQIASERVAEKLGYISRSIATFSPLLLHEVRE
jgi:hypothetical protein